MSSQPDREVTLEGVLRRATALGIASPKVTFGIGFAGFEDILVYTLWGIHQGVSFSMSQQFSRHDDGNEWERIHAGLDEFERRFGNRAFLSSGYTASVTPLTNPILPKIFGDLLGVDEAVKSRSKANAENFFRELGIAPNEDGPAKPKSSRKRGDGK